MLGGCFCGQIRYELSGADYLTVNCHCTMCRRTSGAPFVSWIVVPTDDFKWLSETPRKLASSDHGTRGYCDRCGTPVSCVSSHHPEIIDITLGSLDEPETLIPTRDVFLDTRLPWVSPTNTDE